jgi:UDP-2,3-diacylglucosamine hydrolase
VTPGAVDAALRATASTRIVHGHTHRPATHRWSLDGCAAERWVLPDWDFDARDARARRGGYLEFVEGAARAVALAP